MKNDHILTVNSRIRLSLVLIFIGSFIQGGFAQNDTTLTKTSDKEIVNDTKADTLQGEKEEVKTKEAVDTSVVQMGNKLFKFIEYENGMAIDRIDLKSGEKKRLLDLDSDKMASKCDTSKFRGHWSGVELGINEFVNNDFSFSRPEEYRYLGLKTWRSWNFNFNFAQFSIPVCKNRAGFVTGMGLEMNSYYFKNDVSLQVDEATGNIEERILTDDYNVRRSKLRTTYLTVPILFETQISRPGRSEYSYFSVGVIGGMKVGSALKVVHEVDGDKRKFVERGADLNMNRFRAGVTARMGSRDKDDNSSGLFATYYFTPFFEDGKGPELYPIEVGFRVGF